MQNICTGAGCKTFVQESGAKHLYRSRAQNIRTEVGCKTFVLKSDAKHIRIEVGCMRGRKGV